MTVEIKLMKPFPLSQINPYLLGKRWGSQKIFLFAKIISNRFSPDSGVAWVARWNPCGRRARSRWEGFPILCICPRQEDVFFVCTNGEDFLCICQLCSNSQRCLCLVMVLEYLRRRALVRKWQVDPNSNLTVMTRIGGKLGYIKTPDCFWRPNHVNWNKIWKRASTQFVDNFLKLSPECLLSPETSLLEKYSFFDACIFGWHANFCSSLVMVLIMSNTNRVDLPGMCFVLMIPESWIKVKR